MSEPKRGTTAGVTVIEKRRLKVVFNDEVSVKQAKRAVKSGDIYDILDEDTIEIIEVVKVEFDE